jgi:GAF domain-containing protein
MAAEDIFDVLHYDALTFYLYDDLNDSWRLLHQEGVRDSARLLPVTQLTDSAVCRAREFMENRRGAVYTSVDPAKDPVLRGRFAREEGIRTTVLVRLNLQQRFLGIMFVNFRALRRLDWAETEYMKRVAVELSVVLSNAVRIEKEGRRLAGLSALRESVEMLVGFLGDGQTLYDSIAEAARVLLGATHAILFRSGDSGELRLSSYSGGEPDFTHRYDVSRDGVEASALKCDQQRVITDIQHNAHSRAKVHPSLVEAGIDVLGCWSLMPRGDSPHLLVLLFDRKPDDLHELAEAAQILAKAAQVAIDNSRSLANVEAATRQAVEELNALTRVQSRLAAAAGTDELLELVFASLVELTRAPQACVALYDKEAEILRLVKHTGLQPGAPSEIPKNRCLAGLAVETGLPIVVSNERDLQQYEDRFAHVLNERSRSCIIVPAGWGSEWLALLVVESDENDAFGAHELGFMKRLAPTVAASIHAVREREELAAGGLAQQELAFAKQLLVLRATIMHEVQARLIDARAAAETLSTTEAVASSPEVSAGVQRLLAQLNDGAETMRKRLLAEPELKQPELRPRKPAEILSDAVSASFKREFRVRGIAYEVNALTDELILADDYYLAMAFRELINNSLKYLKTDGSLSITVSISKEGSHVVVRFRDSADATQHGEMPSPPGSEGRGHVILRHIVRRLHGGDIDWQPHESGMEVVLRFPPASDRG